MGLSLSKESLPRLDPTGELTLTPAVGAVTGETAYAQHLSLMSQVPQMLLTRDFHCHELRHSTAGHYYKLHRIKMRLQPVPTLCSGNRLALSFAHLQM